MGAQRRPVRRGGHDRTHVVFAGSGKRFELTGNATNATPGPDGDFTVVLDRGRSATTFSTRYGDELVPEAVEAERTVSIGGCSGIAPETAGEELMGRLTKAVALPPSSADMALAQSNGDILILRLRADSGRQIPDERRIATECLPASGIVFDLSKRACNIERMVFSPDGLALAVLDSQGTVSVFRVDDGPLGQSDGARLASIHMSGRADQVAFGPSGDELRIVTVRARCCIFTCRWPRGRTGGPISAPGHAPYRSQRGGELRATICGRLADVDAGLVRLPDADLAEVSAAFPGLGLTPADQAACEKRGPLALP